MAEGDEVLTTPYQRKEIVKAKKSVQKDQQRKVAYDQCAQRITLACLNCLLGAKIPAKVRKLWATAGIGCIGKMSKRQLVSVRPPLLRDGCNQTSSEVLLTREARGPTRS